MPFWGVALASQGFGRTRFSPLTHRWGPIQSPEGPLL